MLNSLSLISDPQPPVAGYGNMMNEYTLNKARKAVEERQARLDNVKSAAEALRYVEDVRGRLKASFGPFPERTPLNAQVTSVKEFDGMRIENIIFESRPDVFVSANLYLPLKTESPVPGVVIVCGHAASGKEYYQFLGWELARCGYAGLAVDPFGQGERTEIDKPLLNGKILPGACTEHTVTGNKLSLLGEFLGTWFVWDGIRAIDYLISRPEIDPSRIGITGSSGGGTQTSYITAFDRRLAFAAPSCYMTGIRNTIENERIPDPEQIPPGFLVNGLDYADFLIADAPHPVIIMAQDNDFVDLRGAEQAYRDISKIYNLLNAADKVKLFTSRGDHAYCPEHRNAMIDFFNRYSGLDIAWKKQSETIPAELLYCAPNGKITNIPGAKTLQALIIEAAESLAQSRPEPDAGKIRKVISEKLKFNGNEISVPYHRNLRPFLVEPEPAMFLNRFALEPEPGIVAVLAEYSGTQHSQIYPEASAVLYIPDINLGLEIARLKKILTGFTECSWYGLNMRGKGECRSLTLSPENLSYIFHAMDYRYSCTGNMLGEPYLKWQVTDIVAAVKLLKKCGAGKLHLVGCGQGTVAAAMAALLYEGIDDVTLFNPLRSWLEMIKNPEPEWPFSCVLPGILKEMDLPDIYRALNGRIQFK